MVRSRLNTCTHPPPANLTRREAFSLPASLLFSWKVQETLCEPLARSMHLAVLQQLILHPSFRRLRIRDFECLQSCACTTRDAHRYLFPLCIFSIALFQTVSSVSFGTINGAGRLTSASFWYLSTLPFHCSSSSWATCACQPQKGQPPSVP